MLTTDRPTTNRQFIWDLTDPPPEFFNWRWPYNVRVADKRYILDTAGRKAVIARIVKGDLGIDDKVGLWNGSFWAGLRLSGVLRQGPGTEFRIWERQHQELIADLSEMPLMKKLEPKAAKHGQRRLRRCYAAYLPSDPATERSLLAGLFAGAVVRNAGGETWMELPDKQDVRAVLEDWGIPFSPLEIAKGRRLLRVSPLFGQLVMHLMPPHSAKRMLSIQQAGGCPYLSVVLWQMALTRKNYRYLPFPEALPFGICRATFFRRGWHRRELNKAGWLDLGIRVTPKLRELLDNWYQRKASERHARSTDLAASC